MPNITKYYQVMIEKEHFIKRLNEIEDRERAIRKILDSSSTNSHITNKVVYCKKKEPRSISIDELNGAWGRIISAKGGR